MDIRGFSIKLRDESGSSIWNWALGKPTKPRWLAIPFTNASMDEPASTEASRTVREVGSVC
jgi:hypothetical protein